MKYYNQYLAIILNILATGGFIIAFVFQILYFFIDNKNMFEDKFPKFFMENLFNFIFVICLTYLVVETDNEK